MKRLLAALAALLLAAMPVQAAGVSATIAPTVSFGSVTYDVSVSRVRNPYLVWVGQRCYLAGELVDTQHQGIQWTTVTPAKGNKADAIGFAGPFETSGIHHGSAGDTTWTSDQCEAWVWIYPDLDPIAATSLFAT